MPLTSDCSRSHGAPFTFILRLCAALFALHLPVSLLADPGNGAAAGSPASFACTSAPPFIEGDAAPASSVSEYLYSTAISNDSGLPLGYRWSVIDRNGIESDLRAFESTATGLVYSTADGLDVGPGLSLSELGPIGPGAYTLRLRVNDVGGGSGMPCDLQRILAVGALDASYGFSIGGPGTWTNAALPVGRQICATNSSTHQPLAPAPPSDDALQYTWQIGGSPASNSLGVSSLEGEVLPCFSFTSAGSFPLTLEVRSGDASLSDSFTSTFNVFPLPGIVIGRNPLNNFSSSQSFTATTVGISSGLDWVFDRLAPTSNPAFATRNNNPAPSNVGGFTPGTYRATVTGSGPLGSTTTSIVFDIVGANDLRARFSSSQIAGVAPMTACFTDQSFSGTPILLWEWDLDGDGSFEVSGQAPGCATYAVAGQTVAVTLRATNAAFSRSASTSLRTYTGFEARQDFRIEPQGGSTFCFAPVLDGAQLTAWQFGDGNGNSVPDDPACHTYANADRYVVEMCFVDTVDASVSGCVVRSLNVTGAPIPPSALSGTASCAGDTATFTVTNTGAVMPSPDTVRVSNAAGGILLVAPLELGAGDSASFEISGQLGALTLAATDADLSTSITCVAPPRVTVVKRANPAGGTAVLPGQQIGYEIEVLVADGPLTADLVLIDTPTGPLQIGAITENPGMFTVGSAGSGRSFTLPAGTDVGGYRVRYNAIVLADAVGSVSNTIQVSSDGGDAAADCSACTTAHPLAAAVTLGKSLQTESVPDGIAAPGEQLTYAITLSNSGGVDAVGYTVVDELDPNVQFVSASAPGIHDAAQQRVTWSGLGVPAGGVVVLEVVVQVRDTLPPSVLQVVNLAYPAGEASPPCPGDACVQTPVPIVPALEVNKQVVLVDANGNGLGDEGEVLEYSVSVRNVGNTGLLDLAVNDSFNGAPAITLQCSPSALGLGQQSVCTPYSHVISAAEMLAGQPLVNTASAQASGSAGGQATGVATTTTAIGAALAELQVQKTGPAQVLRGAEISYRIVVQNLGPTSAVDAMLSDPTPAGLQFIATSGDCSTPFPCALGTLAPGDSRVVDARFLVPQNYSGPGQIVNVATAASATPDPGGSSSTGSASTGVVPANPPAQIPVDARWALLLLIAGILLGSMTVGRLRG